MEMIDFRDKIKEWESKASDKNLKSLGEHMDNYDVQDIDTK